MIAQDPADSLQHYPVAMSKFGLNPFGENRFRIVLASTRRSLVFGQWNGAGTPRARFCLTYPHIGPEWILEEWVDAFKFTGCTPAMWNNDSNMNILGPYPHRGEYVMCGDTSFNPADMNIEKLITLVHAADRYTWAEKLRACRDVAERDELGRASMCRDIILDALPSFGHAPFVAYGGHGGTAKTSPVLRSANELGLPVPQGLPGQVTTGGSMIIPKRKRKAA